MQRQTPQTDIQKQSETPTALQKVGARAQAISQALKKLSEIPSEKKQEFFEKFSSRMPVKIEQALEFPIVQEVVSAAGEENVKRYIEFELIRVSALVSVGGNLNNTQVQFIASELISMYPKESIADFKLCFQRGAMGQYGEIFRLDSNVIGLWMKQYVDEKYQVIENKLMKEKENPYELIPKKQTVEDDKHQAWLDKLKAAVDGASERMKVPDLPEGMINEIGHKDYKAPAKTRGYAYFNVRGVMIYAGSQEDAERIAEIALRNGDLEEY